ncbi:MAG: Glycosyl transferase family 39 [Candidatus Amesbacteria bacterium GW2011_GWA2_47_11]|uniref:Glycosyl transferase family 39 n=3 Tax=Candidatus Amesiibacteriota TaxID=1752730 RepID=A0A0G1UEP4_9BACT|nr:MAG: Glycosyl transferase family 39 [Candidatus Amesbacteria bacterium GW2011_GWA2_47_11]KKU92627.1 MAG: Glycosyl transferase family 39 [Candidatus Amesbacteria bacterium GW2011_GWC1_48_10]KKU99769.1 MAG: Glycosyl transferase family 39 [Candidatus Amesbacteria bacterium GW2011_GWA1_48_9]OGD06306.1 MAG: hypothetical protein A3B58_00875 [Candidatus Amesbacteria bacterium RIFCSPLOWO2_01_FULL_48_50]
MQHKLQYLLLALIVIFGFLVRMYKIDNPVADWHSWRQADTASVTRNFVDLGVDLLHPRFDDFSDTSGRGLFNPDGYRFVEFPVFNLIHYTFYTLIPKTYNLSLEYWGRMTSVISALVSAVLIFLLVRRHSRPFTGLLAAFFYLFLPFNIYFTRVILPDPLMVTLYLAALNFFDVWTINHKSYILILTALFGTLAVLVKPVALFFLLPITWYFWHRYKIKMLNLRHFWVLHLAFVLPFALWRLWSFRYPQGVPASLWLLNGDHIRFRPAFFRWLFGERLGDMILGHWGVFPLSLGLFAAGSFLPWVIGALAYLVVFATGNVRHDYYQIPIIPIVSILLALGVIHFATSWTKKAFILFVIFMMLGMTWYDIRGNYQVNNWSIIRAGQAVDRLLPKDALVVAPYNGDTAFLYQTKRRGFTHLPMPIKDLKDRYGIGYYVSVTYDPDTRAIMDQYTIMEQNPEFVIIKLDERPDYWQRKRLE